MQNASEGPVADFDGPVRDESEAAVKREWQTPDFEELDVLVTASAPPVTGGPDGPFNYS